MQNDPQYRNLQMKILELESRINRMEIKKRNTPTEVSITEYYPEWDYLQGGSKMILCFQPAWSDEEEQER